MRRGNLVLVTSALARLLGEHHVAVVESVVYSDDIVQFLVNCLQELVFGALHGFLHLFILAAAIELVADGALSGVGLEYILLLLLKVLILYLELVNFD